MPEAAPLTTRQQRLAQRAFELVSVRVQSADYTSFAKGFPALIQGCGLCQAVAFAQAKKRTDFLKDLADTLAEPEARDANSLARLARMAGVTHYLRLSRSALVAAGWIKRYVEALEKPA